VEVDGRKHCHSTNPISLVSRSLYSLGPEASNSPGTSMISGPTLRRYGNAPPYPRLPQFKPSNRLVRSIFRA
jgi:hypothetical protein